MPAAPTPAATPAAVPEPPKPDPNHKPVIFLIGDSTIRNGSNDNGATAGQWGWGHLLQYYFDESKVTIINDAMGGTSSKSFQTSATLWPLVIPLVQPGDYVLMAFGHNDSQASLKGNGDETQAATGRGAQPGDVMHSFGWYMRQYIELTKAKGATPIVMSLIPRNRWTNGKVGRNTNDYALWAKQAAEQEKVQFIPLNDIIADHYDKLGQDKVEKVLFPVSAAGAAGAVHPNWLGARLNAECVVEGIKALPDCPLKDYLVPNAKAPDVADITTKQKGEPGPTGKRDGKTGPGGDQPKTHVAATAPAAQ